MMEKISIAIDMDDVLADTSEKIIHSFNALHQTDYAPADLATLDLERLFDKPTMQRLFVEMNAPGFTRDLVVKENAVEVVKELNEIYDVFIATAAMEIPGSFHDKFEWLQENFPFLDVNHYVYCGNKKVVHTDYLVDDNLRQLQQFKGTGILYTAPMNRKIEAPFKRVDSWLDAHAYFVTGHKERIEETKERKIKLYEKSLGLLNR